MEGFIYVIALIWSILSLILFFKIWGMTNDVETIKRILLNVTSKTVAANNKEASELLSDSISNLEEGDVVVNIENGQELVVVQIFPDGDVTCKPSKGFGMRKIVKATNLKKKQ